MPRGKDSSMIALGSPAANGGAEGGPPAQAASAAAAAAIAVAAAVDSQLRDRALSGAAA